MTDSIEQYEQNFEQAVNFYNQALEFSENKDIEYTLIGTAFYLQDKYQCIQAPVPQFLLFYDAEESSRQKQSLRRYDRTGRNSPSEPQPKVQHSGQSSMVCRA